MSGQEQKICKNCAICEIRTDSGMIKHYCGSNDTYGVNAFMPGCINWTEKREEERKVS